MLYYSVQNWIFFYLFGFSVTRRSLLVLSAAEHAGGPSVHYDAHIDPGRRSWHVLWMFKVVRTSNFSRGCVPLRRAAQGSWKPICFCHFFRSAAASTAASHMALQALYLRQSWYNSSPAVSSLPSRQPRTVRMCVCICVYASVRVSGVCDVIHWNKAP